MRFTPIVILLLAFHSALGQESAATADITVASLMRDLWEDPVRFERDGKMQMMVDSFDVVSPNELRRMFQRIFEQGGGIIENESTSQQGIIGKLNRRSNKRRKQRFDRKMKHGFRDRVHFPNNKVIIAEGDSWFQFPIILQDIVDHLDRRDDYAVMSLAYGGEWLSNILHENNYLKYYLELKPDVLLMSGGGNDMVGERLASMVDRPENIALSEQYLQSYRDYLVSRLTDVPNAPPCNEGCRIPDHIRQELSSRSDLRYDTQLVDRLMRGRTFINDRFYVLLTLHKLQYYLFLENLRNADKDYFQNRLQIITQGYDYPIPDFKKGSRPSQWILNSLSNHGRWLKLPLMSKGITDPEDQRAVMATILFEFNEMLVDVVTDPRYKDADLYLIDCRGAIEQLSNKSRKFYWNDEMHPSSSVFEQITVAYKDCIDGNQQERVVRLLSLMRQKH